MTNNSKCLICGRNPENHSSGKSLDCIMLMCIEILDRQRVKQMGESSKLGDEVRGLDK